MTSNNKGTNSRLSADELELDRDKMVYLGDEVDLKPIIENLKWGFAFFKKGLKIGN